MVSAEPGPPADLFYTGGTKTFTLDSRPIASCPSSTKCYSGTLDERSHVAVSGM